MNKKFFALKLNPCRPDFAQTMTDNEKAIMQQHLAYLRKYMDEGVVHIFGPVMDPKGTYGFGVISVDNEDEVTELIKNDPASSINQYEYYPMLAVLPQPK
jgi:uncharacterized protein YciI